MGFPNAGKEVGKAADEIDRLRAEVEKWRAEVYRMTSTVTLEDYTPGCPRCGERMSLHTEVGMTGEKNA